VWTEQGIGDEIMFCSLLPELQDQVSQLIIQCDDRLVPLFKRSFPTADVLGRSAAISENQYDTHIPMGDLGSRFRQNADKFKGRGNAFLRPDENRAKTYKTLLENYDKPIIGISWRSGSHHNGTLRSVCVERLASVLGSFGVTLLCLQYGENTSTQVDACRNRTGVEIKLLKDLDLTHDLDGVAAAICACDLVVSVGNTVAHLSAACGVPTWLLAAQAASWRWMFSGDRTPWYNAVRIFRQAELGQWDYTFSDLEREFAGYLKTSKSQRRFFVDRGSTQKS
jgi:ADP-heptose:LPS heptosyltransferase